MRLYLPEREREREREEESVGKRDKADACLRMCVRDRNSVCMS